jgi:hypothetical protein
MKIVHPKTNIRRTFLAKLCFDFMADIIAIELAVRQSKTILVLSLRV